MSHFPSFKRIALFSVSVLTLVGLFGVLHFTRPSSPAGLRLAANGGGPGSVTVAPLTGPAIQGPYTGEPVYPVVLNIDLSKLPYEKPTVKDVRPELSLHGVDPDQLTLPGSVFDAVAQKEMPAPNMPNPIITFPGLDFNTWGAGWPPDTNGDVGPVYYIQTVNTSIGIYTKTTGAQAAAFTFDQFFASAAAPCNNSNNGDPIVLYDALADRWLISDFSWTNIQNGPYYECIAVSQTGNPVTGGWYLYTLRADDAAHPWLNDYPKLGVWPDAYYMTANMFDCLDAACGSASFEGERVWALNRSAMLAGGALTEVHFDVAAGAVDEAILPSNLRGAPPPAGSPNFMMALDDLVGGDVLHLWRFDVDFVTPANSTFTGPIDIPVANFTLPAGSVPQQGGSGLDTLGDRLMMQLQYRNVGGTESLWVNHSVASGGVIGVRWYEIRNPNGTPTLFQQGTFQPDALYRWMGSLAVDVQGNMAVGYSVSSSSMFPEIRYAGRLVNDPLGSLSQGEATLFAGTGSQTGINRWGDYSAMTVDPVDDCTFWYTTEYYAATGSNWQTRIGSFKFPGCSTYLSSPPPQTVCQAQNALFPVAVGASFTAPVTMTVSGNPAPTTALFSLNPVSGVPTTTVLTIGNTGAVTPGTYPLVITGTDAVTSSVVNTSLTVQAAIASAPSLSAPANGATNVSINPTLMWSAVSGAVEYDVEVATDPGFTNVVYSATVAGTSDVVGAALAPNVTFYWRVRAANVCGDGAYSTSFNFTTISLTYQTACTAPNLAISDNTTVTSTLNIPSGGALLDVDVAITATHSWVGDLQFTLSNGTASSMVIDRPGVPNTSNGCSADNVGVQLNDEGTDGPVESQCNSTPPALFGEPTPNNALSVFDAQPLAGTWSLAVRDNANVDTGLLQQWCVVATLAGTAGPSPSLSLEKTVGTDPAVCATSDTVSVGYGDDVTYCYKVTNTGNVSFTTHSLVDDQLGTLLNGLSYDLPPLASTFFTATTPLTASVVNSATWTASSISYTASASDIATVTVVVTPTLTVNPDLLSNTQGANATFTQTLLIGNVGPGSTLNWAITETPTLPDLTGVLVAAGSTAADRAHSVGLTPAAGVPEVRLPTPKLPPSPTLTEGFDDISTLSASGWYTQNNSNPLGVTGWFQGNSVVFPAQGGAATAYIGANFNNTSGAGTISNWLLTPELNLANGATFVFYTRKVAPDLYPDRLQIRMSTNGASTDVGATETSVGDFTAVLLDINPTLITGVYPTTWTAYTVTVSGLGGPTTGRLAFRYFVTNGGPTGANSDYIGIDTVSYAAPLNGCNAPSDVPWLGVSPGSGSILGGDTSAVDVTFDSTGYAVGVYTGTLCINSDDPTTPQIQVPVTMTVVSTPTYGVQVTPASQAQSGPSNSVVTYTLTVTNTGNVNDTFDVAVTGNAFNTVAPASVSLAPGASTTFEVVVTVGAAGSDVATITLTSQGNGTATASATLSTTVTATTYQLYLPVIRR